MSRTSFELDFDQISVGDDTSFDIQIKEEMLQAFAELSGDFNPLHMDDSFAKSVSFEKRVVHGMLLISFISRLIGMHLPGQNSLILSQNFNYIKPAFIGDKIKVKGIVVAKSEVAQAITLQNSICRDDKEELVSGETKVMVLQSKKKKPNLIRNEGMDLTGRKVLITGGSGEIGISIARHFSEHNADVAITYCHNMEAAERLKSETDQNKGLVSIHSLDLTALDGLTDTIEEINCTTGPFDTFIHCSTGPLAQKDFLEFKWEEIQKDIDIVVKGFYALVRTLVPSMIENKRGNIISILTTDVLGSPQGKNIGYLTAKYGLMGLSKGLAKECGIHNIRVNMISPGLTDTKLVNYLPKRQKDVVAHQTPLKRIAQPDDIAKTALFLASDMSSHLSGVNIPVCGGNAML